MRNINRDENRFCYEWESAGDSEIQLAAKARSLTVVDLIASICASFRKFGAARRVPA